MRSFRVRIILGAFLSMAMLFSSIATGQSLPDSIVITRNTYANSLEGSETLYRTVRYPIISEGEDFFLNDEQVPGSKVRSLLAELKRPDNRDNSLAKYGIDANRLKTHPADLLDLYKNKGDFDWNQQQRDHIHKVLADPANYKAELDKILAEGGSYGMHHWYKDEYVVEYYEHGEVTSKFRSRKFAWGYKVPWVDQRGDTLFNFNIEKRLTEILGTKEDLEVPKGDKLLKYLVNKIVDGQGNALYKLSPFSFQKEIDELKADFKVLEAEETYGSSRFGRDPSSIRLLLKNDLMPGNVYMYFMASKKDGSIYSRDSVKKDYAVYVDRILSIKFVSEHLKANPQTRLDIWYFNNRGIDAYNIDAVNKDPKGWEAHDKWVDGLKWDSTHGIKQTFDVKESIKTSESVNCGCNYRFDRSYIEKAIMFQVKEAGGQRSVWFLLPDGKVLLYIMGSETALGIKRSDLGQEGTWGTLFACAMFDSNGNRVVK